LLVLVALAMAADDSARVPPAVFGLAE